MAGWTARGDGVADPRASSPAPGTTARRATMRAGMTERPPGARAPRRGVLFLGAAASAQDPAHVRSSPAPGAARRPSRRRRTLLEKREREAGPDSSETRRRSRPPRADALRGGQGVLEDTRLHAGRPFACASAGALLTRSSPRASATWQLSPGRGRVRRGAATPGTVVALREALVGAKNYRLRGPAEQPRASPRLRAIRRRPTGLRARPDARRGRPSVRRGAGGGARRAGQALLETGDLDVGEEALRRLSRVAERGVRDPTR